MRLDLTSFMFGVELKGGAGTPAWGTALGQGAEKKLNPQSDNFYAGLIYSAIEDVSNVKCPLGKGGAVVVGGQPNDKFSVDLASKFTKIYANGKKINGAMFILLVTKEKESVHAGRRTLKYNIKITYNENRINEECVNKMISALDLNENSAWLVYDIDIINQDELHFSVLVIDKNGKKVYENSDERKKDFERLLSENNIEINNELDSNTNQFKRNRIVFGAPGTGKSFKLNTEKDQLVQSEEQYERVTFHPDYTYANFVGIYKPIMKMEDLKNNDIKDVLSVLNDQSKSAQQKHDELYDKFADEVGNTRLQTLVGLYDDGDFVPKNKSGEDTNTVFRNLGRAIRRYVKLVDESDSGNISYEYVPGPFMRLYVKAKKDPYNNYLLLIEEINRANVAAVFGDLFQLLDRKEDGTSEYPIEASEDIKKFLKKEGVELVNNKIEIPKNLFIWATMNSADQGVFPMDTAFKRRWDFEYIGIDAEEEKIKNRVIELKIENGCQYFTWNMLRKAINDHIAKNKINEDKQLGPFFVSEKILNKVFDDNNIDETINSEEKFINVFKNKILMYLFEDVFKSKPMKIFNDGNHTGIYRYSEICDNLKKIGLKIFCIDGMDKVFTMDKTTIKDILDD